MPLNLRRQLSYGRCNHAAVLLVVAELVSQASLVCGAPLTEQHFQADAGDVSAQDKNIELQREVRWHEEQRLKEYERLEAVQLSARRNDTARSAEKPAAVVHDDRATLTRSVGPRHMPAGVQDGHVGHEDAATGSGSEEEGDDEELASYSRIHGLTQPWPSEQPGPSRQRRQWDAARNHGTSGEDAMQTGPPHHARGGYAADGSANRSHGEGSAVGKDRASVSWDVQPDALDPAADADDVDEQSSRQQHNDDAADNRWAATRSDRDEDFLGGYRQPQHDAHAGTSWQPHGVLGPTRSVSPSRAASRQHAERAEPSIRRAWAPRSGMLVDDVACSQQQVDAAETRASGKQHSASGQHADGESRAYWRRFAADTIAQGSSVAACNRDSWGRVHDEHGGHGHMPATMPQTKVSEHARGTVSGTAVSRADGAGSGPDARRKVSCMSAAAHVLVASFGVGQHLRASSGAQGAADTFSASDMPDRRVCHTGQRFKRAANGRHQWQRHCMLWERHAEGDARQRRRHPAFHQRRRQALPA